MDTVEYERLQSEVDSLAQQRARLLEKEMDVTFLDIRIRNVLANMKHIRHNRSDGSKDVRKYEEFIRGKST